MRAPTFGSLFAGVGGFDLGLEAAGWQCAFQVEWDKHCQSVLRHHWPTVPKWGDVQEVDGATLPPVDMITFGSPCQDLSVAGKRAGLQGGRSSMFFEATRIIKEMRNATNNVYPRTAIWENVPGALTSNNGADFGAVLDEMAELGAVAIEWAVLDAQHFGVPQRRRRVFVVAIFDAATANRCPDPLLPVSEGRRGDFAKGRKKGQDVAGSVATSVDKGNTHRKLGHGHYVEDDTASTLKQCGYKDATDLTVVPFVMDRASFNQGENAQYKPMIEQTEVSPSLIARGPHAVAQPIPIADHATRFAGSNGDRKGVGKGNGFGVGEPGDPMNTLTQGDRHAVAQPIIFDGTQHDDFRMETEIVPTLKQRMGTGGGQVPMVAEPVVAAFKPTQGANAYSIGYGEEIAPTLEAGGGGNMPPAIIQPVAIVTHDVVGTLQSRSHKGVNHEGARDGQLVIEAEPVTVFQPSAMIRLGGGVSDDIVPTLRAEAKRGDNEPHIAQPIAFESTGVSWGVNEGDTSPPIKVGTGLEIASPPSVATGLAVRRLTPLECERLMGWPDHHTRWTDEGKEQADTHRYKQCGNGVAAPVAEWIGRHLHPLHVHHD